MRRRQGYRDRPWAASKKLTRCRARHNRRAVNFLFGAPFQADAFLFARAHFWAWISGTFRVILGKPELARPPQYVLTMTDTQTQASEDADLGTFSFNDYGESGWSALPTNEPYDGTPPSVREPIKRRAGSFSFAPALEVLMNEPLWRSDGTYCTLNYATCPVHSIAVAKRAKRVQP